MAKFVNLSSPNERKPMTINLEMVKLFRPGKDGGTHLVFSDEKTIDVAEDYKSVLKQL